MRKFIRRIKVDVHTLNGLLLCHQQKQILKNWKYPVLFFFSEVQFISSILTNKSSWVNLRYHYYIIYLRKRILIEGITFILSLLLQVYLMLFLIQIYQNNNTLGEYLKRRRLVLLLIKHTLWGEMCNQKQMSKFENNVWHQLFVLQLAALFLVSITKSQETSHISNYGIKARLWLEWQELFWERIYFSWGGG